MYIESQNLHQTCLTHFADHLIPLQDPQFVFATKTIDIINYLSI